MQLCYGHDEGSKHPICKVKARGRIVAAAIHTNSESRAVSEVNYELTFEDQARGRLVWFNYAQDTLLFINIEAL